MKLLHYVILILLFTSCSIEDNLGNSMQNLAPTLAVEIPEHFVHNESYDLGIIYKRPSSCHVFSGLDIVTRENEITVGVVTSIRANVNCAGTGNLRSSAVINFVAEREDFYIFKFWQGKNRAGRDEFLIVEVPVTPPGSE